MALNDPRYIGRVRHVRGATVTVELDRALAGTTPLWEGRLQPVGQVGSLVQLPQGPIRLLASVTLVGIAELSGQLEPSASVQVGDRWLQVQLLGEIDGLGRFQRGVSSYPGLDDPVLFTTPDELRAVYPTPGDSHVALGALSAASEISLALNAQALVTRHSAIVGSTGSGKTSAVATLLQGFAQGWKAANIVVVDPHGEYATALEQHASVRSVLGEGNGMLRVPYWALPADDVLRAFSGREESPAVQSRFRELVQQERRKYVESADWLAVPAESITPDTPVPFDLRRVWYQMDYENRATYERVGNGGGVKLKAEGNPEALVRADFEGYNSGNQAPYKATTYGTFGTVPDRMRLRLSDARYRFLQQPTQPEAGQDPLVTVVQEWLGDQHPISVLDFSGVPTEVTDLAVGGLLQLLLELAIRSGTEGIGRPRPVLVVLEEAHRYLGNASTVRQARDAANRMAREGRKYGMGLMLVTQRPAELPDTALSQVGTIAALRLTNGADQARVKGALPDAVAGLAEALPALRTGEALVVGEAVTLPTRTRVFRPHPEPQAQDPSLAPWRGKPGRNEVAKAIARWRGADIREDDNG